MTETCGTLSPETAETPQLDWDLIDRLCANRGATTGTERAEMLGVGRASLYRWRDGAPMTLANAAKIAARLGLALPDIMATGRPTAPPAPPKPPAGPGAPRPPAGPRGDQ